MTRKPRNDAIRRTRNGVREKLCGTCTWQPVKEFYGGNPTSPDGLQGRCKTCQRADKRVRRSRQPMREPHTYKERGKYAPRRQVAA